jgi:hypothetical protein
MNGVLTGTASAPSRAAATLPVSHEDLGQALRLATSALPPGISARLTRRCGASGTRGGRRGEEWILTFPARWRGRIDPLTGWWGGGDPMTQLTLRFPTRRAAEEYARREGLSLETRETPRVADACHRAAAFAAAQGMAIPADPSLPWLWDGRVATPSAEAAEGDSADGPGEVNMELALLNPAAVFADPGDVVAHSRLTPAQKQEILARWEYDARLIEAAQAEGMPEAGEPSRLAEVLAARFALRGEGAARPMRGTTAPMAVAHDTAAHRAAAPVAAGSDLPLAA